MISPKSRNAKILVAADSVANVTLVRRLLEAEFSAITCVAEIERLPEAFRHMQPDVLVFAFKELEVAEHQYLGLYRTCREAQRHPHRTIVLCDKGGIGKAYALCRDGLFDDYVLFWPMAHDAFRLQMAAHHAVRELLAAACEVPDAAAMVTQARNLQDLHAVVSRRIVDDEEGVAAAAAVGVRTESAVGDAFERFSDRLGDTVIPAVVDRLEQELQQLRDEALQLTRHALDDAVGPLARHAEAFRTACDAHLQSMRSLVEMAHRVSPLILVVDDEELHRDVIGGLLGAHEYRLLYASSGVGALALLREHRPDLILLDVLMPGMSGPEVVRQLKLLPQYADIPVVMVSGKSEKETVVESVTAGAIDFVVKPVDPHILMEKVSRALQRAEAHEHPVAETAP